MLKRGTSRSDIVIKTNILSISKRSQISVFIVLVLVIIGIIIAMFIFKPENKNITPDQQNIYNSIQSCVNSVAEDSIYFAALQGGYYDVPDPKENYSFIQIPIYWDSGKDKVPSKETIELEIMKYIKDMLPRCIDNLEIFKKNGFNLDKSKISGEVEIIDKNVNFKLKYPLTIKKENFTLEFKDFSKTVDLNFYERYDFVKQIIEEQKNDENSLHLGFITDLAYKNNFNFETININENEVLISLVFDKNSEKPFIYTFINKYNWKK